MITMSLDDKLFDFVYAMAFRDATMRKAFARKIDEKDSGFHDRKMAAKREARESVKAYIEAIIDENSEGMKPENTIIEVCKKTGDFGMTFGNSQKLVNMTAKYMFICAYANNDMRKRFRDCHCPMDGAMMDLLRIHFVNYSELNEFRESEEFKAIKEMGSTWSWSQLKYDNGIPKQYSVFQQSVERICKILKGEIMPIEVDYLYWDWKNARNKRDINK